AGAIYVRNPRRNDLEVMVCQGLRGEYTGARVRVGEGLAGYVAETGQGQIVDDYRAFSYRTAIYEDEEFSAVIAAPLIHHGQVVGVLDVLDDAEKRAFADEDLWLLDLFAAQAAQAVENARTFVELESAYRKQRELDRLKDDFIATASHELRTPLTGVQGFLELLIDHVGADGDPTVIEFAQRSADSAQELADIAERLLQTSRLDTGSLEIHAGQVRLAPVVEDSLRMFRALQEAQGMTHTLSAEVPPELYVYADLGRLKEVLDNLISNAIKYSPQGGKVIVRGGLARFDPTGAVSLVGADVSAGISAAGIDERPTVVLPHLARSAEYPDAASDPAEADPTAPLPTMVETAMRQPFVVVTVSDEGMGIAPEERWRLFGRFARMDAARESQIRGTGLGLYICRQTMRAMGGDVWLASSMPGRGSVFAFALPATN
ncbi:MAG TPA: GAF domain-containing sensor histidine kinase, partial [Ktedonobacterales bacterium]|nr:GAF domain-containing sensor histidine kinase [Ktedonobacterales bacterium]